MNDEAEQPRTVAPAYFGSEMNAFNDGVQMSTQTRIAFEFVKALAPTYYDPHLEGSTRAQAAECVRYAYDLAEELMTQGVALGYVRDISDSHECNAQTKKMIDRQVDSGLYQAKRSQRAQRDAMTDRPVEIPLPGQNRQ